MNLSNAAFIPMGGPQAHVKLKTPVNERYRDLSSTELRRPADSTALIDLPVSPT